MKNIISQIVHEYARDMNILVVDDDDISLDIYKEVFEGLFNIVDTACDGQDAYEQWSNGKVKYDLVITDLLMPNMDGFELIDKIRLKSLSQHIIVLSAIVDINEMRDILDLGIDGILLKPYNQEKMFTIFSRVLKLVYNDKLLKRQAIQLRLFAQENIKAKSKIHVNKLDTEEKTQIKIQETLKKKPEEKKYEDLKKQTIGNIHKGYKDNKYHTRAHLSGDTAENFTADLDYFDMDRVEVFQDKIEHYQNVACAIVSADPEEAKVDLADISQGLNDLIELLNHFGMFSVTAGATKKLIEFIGGIETEQLEDYDKKDLLVDGLMAILEDLNKWIDMVFVQKNTDNINYFDASFANTCLELESIFFDVELADEEESMEFF